MFRYTFAVCIALFALIPVTAQEFVDDAILEEIVESYTTEDGEGIVVFVDDNGETATAAYGLADIDNGIPITTETAFRIGSVTKPMAAVVVLSLVEEGALSLDDPIADYLPAEVVQNVANADEATVRQILQMTSGIYNYTESDAFDDATFGVPYSGWTAAETVEFAYGEPAYFQTGEGYTYSNTNYNLAEMIIQEVSGEPFDVLLDEIIFQPLDMTSCFLETPDRFAEAIPRGYVFDGGVEDVTEDDDAYGLADGGVICNMEDLAKFPVGLAEGELIGEALLDEMLTPVEDGDGGLYGLGIDLSEWDFGPMASHGGSTMGFNAYMVYLWEEGVVVTMGTNNFDADYTEDVVYDALLAVFGEY